VYWGFTICSQSRLIRDGDGTGRMGRVVSWRLGCVSGSVFVLLFSILGAPARVMSGFFQICFYMRDPCSICFFL
jgi:hypothetical protein